MLFTPVFRHGDGALNFVASFRESAELEEQVCPDAGEQMIVGQCGLVREVFERGKACGWAFGHSDGYGSIEPDNG